LGIIEMTICMQIVVLADRKYNYINELCQFLF
jgi:hypothetical protein